MDDEKAEIQVPSVNSQVLAGVILAGIWMMGINRKLRIANQNIYRLMRGQVFLDDHLTAIQKESTTVKDVVRLAAIHETKGS